MCLRLDTVQLACQPLMRTSADTRGARCGTKPLTAENTAAA